MDEHHYLIRGGIEGSERMRVVGRVMRPSTILLLDRAGVAAGHRCLDVGCGAGEVTFDLAAMVGSSGHVVGLDLDATKIELARAEAETMGLRNVDYWVADVMEGLGDHGDGDEAGYDVVYSRFVLTHLKDPAATVAAMRSVLRPGGRLVVEDIDYRGSFSHPVSERYLRYEEIYVRTAQANGGDPHIGARLPELLTAAGFPHVEVSIAQPAGVEGEVKELPALTLANIRTMAARHGVAEPDEVDSLVDHLHTLAKDPATFVANPRIVQVWARAPS